MAYATMHTSSVNNCQVSHQDDNGLLYYAHMECRKVSNCASTDSSPDPSSSTVYSPVKLGLTKITRRPLNYYSKMHPQSLKNMCTNRHMFVVSRSSYRPSYWFQALGLLDTLGFQLRGTARRRDVGAPALSTPVLMTSFVLGIDVNATVLSGTERVSRLNSRGP